MADLKLSAATAGTMTDAGLLAASIGGADRSVSGAGLKTFLGLLQGAGAPEGVVTGTVGQLYLNTTSGLLYQKMSGTGNTGWVITGAPRIINQSTASQTLTTNGTSYITGSDLLVPPSGLKVGTRMYWSLALTKTGAGTAANSIDIRVGTAGTTADTSRGSLAMGAGTGVIDAAIIEIWAHMRSVGAGTAAVLVGALKGGHNLSATGFFVVPVVVPTPSVSAGFDSTVAALKIGLSWTSGASMVPTVVQCQATMENL